MVEVDELLEINNEIGRVCYINNYNGKDYAWIAFIKEENENNNFIFKVFELKKENDKILTKEIDDSEILQRIASDYTASIVEKHDIVDSFLGAFDEE